MLSLVWTLSPPGVRWETKPEHWPLPLGNLTSNQSVGTASLKLTPTGREGVSDRGHSLAEYTGLEKSEQVFLYPSLCGSVAKGLPWPYLQAAPATCSALVLWFWAQPTLDLCEPY